MLCSVSSRTFRVVSLEVVDCVSLLGGVSLRCFAACLVVRFACVSLEVVDCVSLLGGVLVVSIRVNSPLGVSFRVLF